MDSFFPADDGVDKLPRTASHPFNTEDATAVAVGSDDAGYAFFADASYSSFANASVEEEVEEEIAVEDSNGVPVRHVSGGYSPSPFSLESDFLGGDGPILPLAAEMGREEGVLLREWCSWDKGYDMTARFLDYCDSLRPWFVTEMNAKMKDDGYNDEYFMQILGKSVQQLWFDYKYGV